MPINTALLIAAPMLQDYFVDNANGQAMADGVITCYQDNARTVLKNWYYQTGSPGNYTYITLPNPMTLSAVGTIVDANGNDTIPFFYPYSEVDNTTVQTYYITVDDANGQRQFTRQNFPFLPTKSPQPVAEPTLQNLLTNNVFWRNVGTSYNATNLPNSLTINGNTLHYATLAPSQHDGLIMSDIQFFKNTNGATDTINFYNFVLGMQSFSNQILPNDITPEFYFNLACSATGSETSKYLQIPIQLHVANLSGVQNIAIALDAMAVTGNPNITVSLFQFLGTGATSPAAVIVDTITLSNTWEKYIIETSFPSSQNVTLGAGGDDAWYLQIGFPTGSSGGTYSINLAKPALYLGTTVPTDDFQTYDQANAVFSSARTGDLRISVNSWQSYGWVPMNDGTIGSGSSSSTTRANIDTWPLFNLLWSIAQPYDSGSNSNPICQMYTSGAAATNFGATAIADFSANKQLALTRAFGKVLMGTVPVSILLTSQSTTFTASSSGGLFITAANNVVFFNGMPIIFTNSGGALPTGLVANAVYYVANFNGTTGFNVSTTFANAIAGTVISYTNAGSGTNTVTSAVTGASTGEYGHVLLKTELPDPITTTAQNHSAANGVDFAAIQSAGTYGTGTISNQGGNQAHNTVQPGTMYNIFIKL